jgi:hypothetical protein
MMGLQLHPSDSRSVAPKGDTPFVYVAFEFVEHWFCVGLLIALSVRHYSC